MSIPTKEEYDDALKIVNAYRAELDRAYKVRLDNFKLALNEYFKNNKVSGCTIKKFEIRSVTGFSKLDIIPTEPPLEESYEGENNDDIEKICKEYGIEASFVYWMYHK